MAKPAVSNAPSWGTRPTSKPAVTPAPSVDDFVNGGGKRSRLNIYLPTDLYKRVKVGCASEGTSMTEVLCELLEQRFPKT